MFIRFRKPQNAGFHNIAPSESECNSGSKNAISRSVFDGDSQRTLYFTPTLVGQGGRLRTHTIKVWAGGGGGRKEGEGRSEREEGGGRKGGREEEGGRKRKYYIGFSWLFPKNLQKHNVFIRFGKRVAPGWLARRAGWNTRFDFQKASITLVLHGFTQKPPKN